MHDTIMMLLAHGGAQEIFDRNAWFWARLPVSIVVVCPSDDVVTIPPILSSRIVSWVECGRSMHHGEDTIRRNAAGYARLLEIPALEYIVQEYDNLNFGLVFPFLRHPGVAALMNWRPAAEQDQQGLQAGPILHHPVMFDRDALFQLCRTMEKLPAAGTDGGHEDRWFSRCVRLAGLPWHDLVAAGEGFLPWDNTIDAQLEWPRARKLIQARTLRHIHGIKRDSYGMLEEFRAYAESF